MYDRLVAVSCWMPEASSRVPPELSCQTEEKNRCREINVFLDVNRIWPKNPYIERRIPLRDIGGVPRPRNVSTTNSRRPSVFCRWLPRRWFRTSSIHTFIPRLFHADRWSSAMAWKKQQFLVRNFSFPEPLFCPNRPSWCDYWTPHRLEHGW